MIKPQNDQGALNAGTTPFRRERLAGHFPGSAWLVSADGDLARVALREAVEESGLLGLVIEGGVLDLDRHRIPARGNEPEHWHYDVRFVLRATDEAFVVNEESHDLAWRRIAEIAHDEQSDASVRRMARKWLARAL